MNMKISYGAAVFTLVLFAHAANLAAGTADTPPPPLSPAQAALFDTPHLSNITHPETLAYEFVRTGPGAYTDSVTERIETIHPDGSKYVDFAFLTKEHRIFFPAVDDFRGNPLLMLFLEHDVRDMRDRTGIAATYYQNRIREAFLNGARITKTEVTLAGKTLPAQEITLEPFADNPRFANLPMIKGKTYHFVLAAGVPGMLDSMAVDEPGDAASGAPAMSETLRFVGEQP